MKFEDMIEILRLTPKNPAYKKPMAMEGKQAQRYTVLLIAILTKYRIIYYEFQIFQIQIYLISNHFFTKARITSLV